jgi:phage protein D
MTTTHRPDYTLRIGSLDLAAADASALASLQVSAGKFAGAAEAVITLGAGVGDGIELDDLVEIDLGWGGERERVFTGRIGAIEPQFGFGMPRLVLRAYDDLLRLMRGARQPRLFENQTPGDIVKAHANAAGVALGSVESGPRLARSYIHRESAYAHCRTLADRSGFDLYASEGGKLQFGRFQRSAADAVLQHGRDLIHVQRRAVAAPAGITVVPESPASSAGDDTAVWLVKDPAAHAATEGEADQRTVSDPALRTREGAQEAARAYTAARWRRGTALATLPGRASLHLGQAVELRGVPQPGLDGLYELLALRHRLDVARGFGTTLTLAGIG